MCRFFSFIQAIIDGEIRYFYSLYSDSHSRICDEFNVKQDRCNQYEWDPETYELTEDNIRERYFGGTDIDMTDHAVNWVDQLMKDRAKMFGIFLSRGREVPAEPTELEQMRTIELSAIARGSKKNIVRDTAREILHTRNTMEDRLARLGDPTFPLSYNVCDECSLPKIAATFDWLETLRGNDAIAAYAVLRDHAHSVPNELTARMKALITRWAQTNVMFNEIGLTYDFLMRELVEGEGDGEWNCCGLRNMGVMPLSAIAECRLAIEKQWVNDGSHLATDKNMIFPCLLEDPEVNPEKSNIRKWTAGKGAFPLRRNEHIELKRLKERVGTRLAMIYAFLFSVGKREQKSWARSQLIAGGKLSKTEIKVLREMIKCKLVVCDEWKHGLRQWSSGGWGHTTWNIGFGEEWAREFNKTDCGIAFEYVRETTDAVVKDHRGRIIEVKKGTHTRLVSARLVNASGNDFRFSCGRR